MGEEGQEGKVFCFPSVCLELEAGITVPRVLQMHSQETGGEREMGMFLNVLRYLAAGSIVCCQTRSSPHSEDLVSLCYKTCVVGTENNSLCSHGEIC